MDLNFFNLPRWPRPCLVCGTWRNVEFGLCNICFFELRRRVSRARRSEGQLNYVSVFQWRPNGEPALRALSHRLKEEDRGWWWKSFAAWLLETAEAKTRLFIPVASRQGRRNHAAGFARALAELAGADLWDGLLRIDHGHTKALNRLGRGVVEFRAKGRLPDCTKYKEVVVVDDVVTTGATARAVYRALGGSGHLGVWCLLDRKLVQNDAS